MTINRNLNSKDNLDQKEFDQEEFDKKYQKMMTTMSLATLHLAKASDHFDITMLCDGFYKVEFEGDFHALCAPNKSEIFAIIPLSNDLNFNLHRLTVGNIGLIDDKTAGLIRSNLNEKSEPSTLDLSTKAKHQFLFLAFDGSHPHYQLLSSSSMAISVPESVIDLTTSSLSLNVDYKLCINEFCQALLKAQPAMRPLNLRGRSRVPRKKMISDMLLYLVEGYSNDKAIAQIENEYNVSERTVRNGFIEIVGITPKQFAMTQQLFRYREALISNVDINNGIEKIAKQVGINAIGRMAAKYCDLFNEKPSDTLKRCQTY